MIFSGLNSASAKLIRLDTDQIVISNDNTAQSLTRDSTGGSTEMFYIPQDALANVGDFVILQLRSDVFNNTGVSRALLVSCTIGDQLITDSISTAGLSDSSITREWFLDVTVTRISATKLAAGLSSSFSNVGPAGSAVGNPRGSFGSPASGQAGNVGFDISGGWPLMARVRAALAVADANMTLTTKIRALRRG